MCCACGGGGSHPPSPPPPVYNVVYSDTVTAFATAAGSVSDFDQAALAALKQSFASAFGATTSQITISIAASSSSNSGRRLSEYYPPPPSTPPTSPPSATTFLTKNALKVAAQAFNANQISAIATYGPIAYWGVSSITDMSELFQDMSYFNADISGWNTSSVTNMAYMFSVRSLGWGSAFNQPLSFDTSSVTTMEGMFQVRFALAPPAPT